MKILLSFALIFVFVINGFSSPLVFKITKEINSKELVELATIDTAKYKQIRIKIKITSGNAQSEKGFVIYGVEGQDELFLATQNRESGNPENDYVFDAPPSKIRVKVKGEGTYSLYVWAN